MPRTSYQYETSPRKYKPEYTRRVTTTKTKTSQTKKVAPKGNAKKVAKKKSENLKTKKAEEKKNKFMQVVLVIAVFGMLLAVSYREISIMEMFNHKKDMESQLAVVEKENGQVQKSIKEEESKLDWNEIKRRATDELGMQTKVGTPVNLEKADNVETYTKMIKEEKTSVIEKIIEYFINK